MHNSAKSFSRRPTALVVAALTATFATVMVLPRAFGNAALASEPNPNAAGSPVEPAQSFSIADAAEERQLITTESGLQYLDIIAGEGESPETGQSVRVHYTGSLENGRVFDSSRGREPFSFALGRDPVIEGWEEGIRTMKPGGRRLLIIPAKLGYGRRGAGRAIPPNATLVFDITLLGINNQ